MDLKTMLVEKTSLAHFHLQNGFKERLRNF